MGATKFDFRAIFLPFARAGKEEEEEIMKKEEMEEEGAEEEEEMKEEEQEEPCPFPFFLNQF